MSDSAATDSVHNHAMLRIMGMVLIFFSIVEIAIGAAANAFFSDQDAGSAVGGYWGAILVFIAGVLGLFSANR